jgi:hypothetical protein
MAIELVSQHTPRNHWWDALIAWRFWQGAIPPDEVKELPHA